MRQCVVSVRNGRAFNLREILEQSSGRGGCWLASVPTQNFATQILMTMILASRTGFSFCARCRRGRRVSIPIQVFLYQQKCFRSFRKATLNNMWYLPKQSPSKCSKCADDSLCPHRRPLFGATTIRNISLDTCSSNRKQVQTSPCGEMGKIMQS